MDVYMARQPIFNKKKNIYGYELLFRGGTANAFPDIDGDTATSKVLANSFFNMGIEQIVGKKVAFVNFTRDLLLKRVPSMFPREKLVVEVLENVEAEQEIIEACKDLSAEGYIIALDDFFYEADLKPLVQLADIIKMDFRATSMEDIESHVENLSEYGVKFLAEKVETHEEFQKASEMGFEFFQGYFFSKPQIVRGKEIPPSKINLIQLVAEANKEDFRFDELEKLVARDVSISYKLLSYINSAFFRRVHEISSIKQAIVMLGETGMKRFISLIVMAKLAEDKPDELIRNSIIRAKMCELLAQYSKSGVSDSELFTLGLFSRIDAIMDQEMEALMEKLPLSDQIKNALVAGKGVLGDFLRLVDSYEKGDWESFSKAVKDTAVDEGKVPVCYMEALGWADSLAQI